MDQILNEDRIEETEDENKESEQAETIKSIADQCMSLIERAESLYNWNGTHLESIAVYRERFVQFAKRGGGEYTLNCSDPDGLISTCRAFRMLYIYIKQGLLDRNVNVKVQVKSSKLDYAEYLASDAWAAKADAAKDRARRKCQVCNATGLLDTHHRTYERIGKEQDDDLIVLCRGCHTLFHENGKLAR